MKDLDMYVQRVIHDGLIIITSRAMSIKVSAVPQTPNNLQIRSQKAKPAGTGNGLITITDRAKYID